MTVTISCMPTAKGIHSFYLSCEKGKFYLFSQKYRRGVREYFGRGISLDKAIDVTRGKGDTAIIRTMRKMLTYIRYTEKEYNIKVLDKTQRKDKREFAA